MPSSPNVPPFIGYVETTVHALYLIRAASQGVIPRVTRRLNHSEQRAMIKSGAVFVFSVEESRIKRWTDGLLWSPSRVVGNFLVYREISERPSNHSLHRKLYPKDDPSSRSLGTGRLTSVHSSNDQGMFKPNGLIKKTITAMIQGSALHLVSYYTPEDIRTGILKQPTSRQDIMGLDLPPHIFRQTNFRVPPKLEIGPDGKLRLVFDAADMTAPKSNAQAEEPAHHVPGFGRHQTGEDTEMYGQCNVLLSELLVSGRLLGKRCLEQNLGPNDAQCMIDYLTKVFDDHMIVDHDKTRRLRSLVSRLSRSKQVFPMSRVLEGVRYQSVMPLFEGAFGCVFKGTYRGRTVAIKAPRLTQCQDNSKSLKAQAKEFAFLAHLSHKNILPFYGIYVSQESMPRICIVSPWMEHGDLNRYLAAFPGALRVPLLLDVITGLQYLHQLKITHTDLKGRNVLVSNAGRAMIADFGISSIAETHPASTTGPNGTPFWTAPEVLMDATQPSAASDIWSYGCLSYEVFTGKKPFGQYRKPSHLISAFINLKEKLTPTPPSLHELHTQLTPGIWEMTMRCCSYNPKGRPTPDDIILFLKNLKVPDNRPLARDGQVISTGSKAEMSEAAIDYDRIYDILNRFYNAKHIAFDSGEGDEEFE